jgi:hypothetical protein
MRNDPFPARLAAALSTKDGSVPLPSDFAPTSCSTQAASRSCYKNRVSEKI